MLLGSEAVATGLPRKALTAPTMRLAVVRSGFFSDSFRVVRLASWKPVSFSTIAPLEMRPAVGTPRVTVAPSPWALKPPMETGPWPTP